MSIPTLSVQGADAPIDLVMGGQGSLPWSIGSIKPGDRGSETVTVTNAGTATAYLRIWVSGIVLTDHGGDGAALSKYLLFSLVADGLTTTMDLPATIDRFPQSPSDQGQLVIGPLAGGTSATLRWTWEFVEAGEGQNDAQGDGLAFSISYMLTDAPPPAASYRYMAVDMMGWQTAVETDSTGVVQHDADAVDPLGVHHLRIAAGTRAIDEEGNVPGRIVLSAADPASRPGGPAGTVWLGSMYLLQAYRPDGTGVNVSFSSPVALVIGVNASTVPAGYLPMGVHMLDGDKWSRLPAGADDLSRWSAEGLLDRTGRLTVFAAPVVPRPSQLHVTAMDVSPEVRENGWPFTISITTGRSVTVTASVTNLGNSSGIFSVELLIDGSVRDTVTAVIEPGEEVHLSLGASGIEDGEHAATVLDRTSRFSSGTSVEWAMVLVPSAMALSALVVIRRKPFTHRPPRGREAVRGRAEKEKAPAAVEKASTEIANPQLLESIGAVWEARRTAEQVMHDLPVEPRERR